MAESRPPTIAAQAHKSCSGRGLPTTARQLYIALIQHRQLPSLLRSLPLSTTPTHSLLTNEQPADHRVRHVHRLTEALHKSAHEPANWSSRAEHLLALGYPELAAGDAYKAILLCDYPNGIVPDITRTAVISGPTPPTLNPDVVESPRSKHWCLKPSYRLLAQALYDCHCHPEALHICTEAESRFPDDPFFSARREEIDAVVGRKRQHVAASGESPMLQRDMLHDGAVLTIPYPWMDPHFLHRSQSIIDLVNQEFRQAFGGCRLDTSSLSGSPIPNFAGQDPQVLGVFAAREIDPGECILVDRAATGCSSSVSGCINCFKKVKDTIVEATCCSAIFCSKDCYQLALSTYHRAICGKDFSWLQSTVEGLSESAAAMRPLLMFRYLATCVQAGESSHPLEHPLIARLQPQPSGRHLDVFTLKESIVRPIQILQQLGVDVFVNSNFDTWVVHTIWTRLANNKQGFPRKPENGGGWIDSISPLMPFFNHSCEPNVECWHDDTTTVRFFAKRRIQEGEELFDSYVNVESIHLEKRHQILWPWFEGPCLCSKCSTERHGTL